MCSSERHAHVLPYCNDVCVVVPVDTPMCSLIVMMCVVVTIDTPMCLHKEKLCAYECTDIDMDGIYIICGDCRSYFVCKNGAGARRKCPQKPNWGFNIDARKCPRTASLAMVGCTFFHSECLNEIFSQISYDSYVYVQCALSHPSR